jgi:hypothetical protein
LHQLRVVSATLVHLELKLDNDAEVQHVACNAASTALCHNALPCQVYTSCR